jgi:cadmium resistance protein CadD (predicted permease)
MKKHVASALFLLLLLFTLVGRAYAADESFIDQFIGSPLLILAAIIVIDVIAFIYHKIRK